MVLCIHGFPTSNYDWSKVSFCLSCWGGGGRKVERGAGEGGGRGRNLRLEGKLMNLFFVCLHFYLQYKYNNYT